MSEGLLLRDGTRLKYPINGNIGSSFMLVFFWLGLYFVIMILDDDTLLSETEGLKVAISLL